MKKFLIPVVIALVFLILFFPKKTVEIRDIEFIGNNIQYKLQNNGKSEQDCVISLTYLEENLTFSRKINAKSIFEFSHQLKMPNGTTDVTINANCKSA